MCCDYFIKKILSHLTSDRDSSNPCSQQTCSSFSLNSKNSQISQTLTLYPSSLFFPLTYHSVPVVSLISLKIKPRGKSRLITCMAMSNRHSLSINKNSEAIAKTKPKVRIIHLFAPEIIKTDVSNFRELVQRLTGKPSAQKHDQEVPTKTASRHQHKITRSSNVSLITSEDKPKKVMKEGVGLCREETPAGDYLGGFSDLEGFVSDFSQFPTLLPFEDTHTQGYEQLQL